MKFPFVPVLFVILVTALLAAGCTSGQLPPSIPPAAGTSAAEPPAVTPAPSAPGTGIITGDDALMQLVLEKTDFSPPALAVEGGVMDRKTMSQGWQTVPGFQKCYMGTFYLDANGTELIQSVNLIDTPANAAKDRDLIDSMLRDSTGKSGTTVAATDVPVGEHGSLYRSSAGQREYSTLIFVRGNVLEMINLQSLSVMNESVALVSAIRADRKILAYLARG